MIRAWWEAHALEFVIWAIAIGFLAFVWLVEVTSEIRAERKRKRRDGLL